MIDLAAAREIASRHLKGMESEGLRLALLDVETITKPYGWVFFYESTNYLQTGKFSDRLVGNAPFLVRNDNSEIHVFGTARATEDYIADYERSHGIGQ